MEVDATVRICQQCGNGPLNKAQTRFCSRICYHASRELPVMRKFEAKYLPVPESGCWLWTAAINPGGYGIFAPFGTHTVLAHRFSFQAWRGEITEGLELDHLCRVRCCVNPDHLELVTRRENMLRGEHHSARAHRTGICKRGHQLGPHPYRPGKLLCPICAKMWSDISKARQTEMNHGQH